jgi:hypothetical protein
MTSKCPKCGEPHDMVTGPGQPERGDVSICLRCGHTMAFSKSLRLRELTKAERRKADNDPRITRLEAERRVVMEKHKH